MKRQAPCRSPKPASRKPRDAGHPAAPASSNNQLNGYTYDAACNVLNDGLGHNFTYDGEDRIVSTSGSTTYVDDGDGKRVVKCAGTYPSCSSGTVYWTGVGAILSPRPASTALPPRIISSSTACGWRAWTGPATWSRSTSATTRHTPHGRHAHWFQHRHLLRLGLLSLRN